MQLGQVQIATPGRMNIFSPMGGNVPYGAFPVPWGAPPEEDIPPMMMAGVYPVPHGGFPVPWGPQTEEEAKQTYLGQAQDRVWGRIEVRDEVGNFVEGASVSVVHDGQVVLTKRTDRGGNATFYHGELAKVLPESAQKGDVFYRIEASGYKPAEVAFVAEQLTSVDLAPKPPSQDPLGIPIWGWLLGAGAVAGLLVAALSKQK